MRRDRGAVVLLLLAFLVVVMTLVSVAAGFWHRASSSAQERLMREEALLWARGGVHAGAARGAFEIADARGRLQVTVDGDRITAVAALADAAGRPVLRRASARSAGGRLVDWEEQ